MDLEIKARAIIHRKDAEAQSFSKSKSQSAERAEITLTERIIGAAIEVHRNLGPGLRESAYEECRCYELSHAGLNCKQQVQLPIPYHGLKLDCGYRLVVEGSVIIEIKTVGQLLPIHSPRSLTYLRLSGIQIGLLLNFQEPILKKGIKRLVHHFREPAPKPVSSAPSAPEAEEDATRPTTTQSLRNSASPRLCGEFEPSEPKS
jgi:GxxExxY protein